MTASVRTVRRSLFGVFAGGLLAFGSAAIVAPVANFEPAPAYVYTSNVSGQTDQTQTD